ncbi:uncharacterized protein LOC126791570 [Argentina anserina]|uniref:uncharacterized protein LOC126791570 n=1 Tax=Argentina anserina TaxID=57926 RepID=UPI002176565D|nr:uncharacterized protein LOC126791570 [Potentilla anserina]
MASWKKTITTPFRKAAKVFNQQPNTRDQKKSQLQGNENNVTALHGEVMACGYEDVQVMWSILDKSNSSACNITS